MTKIASTLEFKLPESFDLKIDSNEALFMPKYDGDNFLRFNSSRRGANDKVDFAQKYLFKNSLTQDNLDILSHYSEESEASYDDDCDSQYHGETSQGTLDQNELTHQLTISSKEVAPEKNC